MADDSVVKSLVMIGGSVPAVTILLRSSNVARKPDADVLQQHCDNKIMDRQMMIAQIGFRLGDDHQQADDGIDEDSD